jgi:hypothetical protein
MRVLVEFVAMVLATAAQAADMPNVNLTCAGKEVYSLDGKEVWSDFQETYRVDYDANRWCKGFCEETSPIYNITDEFLFLKYDTEDRNVDKLFMNRITGKLVISSEKDHGSGKLVRITATGECAVEPFTGLKPIKKF